MAVHALVVGAGGFPDRLPTEEEHAAGVAPLLPLPSVAGAVRDVAHALEAAGVSVTGPLLDPTLKVWRTVWESARARAGESPLIVHFSGHGQQVDEVLYLAVKKSRTLPGRVRSTSVDMEELLKDVEHGGGGPVLFLLDVCGGGAALTPQLAKRLAGVKSRNAWVIAACAADQITYGARFSRATADVVDRIARRELYVSPTLSHVPVGDLAKEIHEEMVQAAHGGADDQDVVCTQHDEAAQPPAPFLPNPHHAADPRERFRVDTDAALRRYSESLDPRLDLLHFASRAAGTRDADVFLFSGRRAQLRRIEEWLGDDPARGRRLLVVTGSPGVGKSALLGATVCTLHPALTPLRARLSLPHFRPAPAPLLAVHACRLTTQQVRNSLYRQALALVDGRREGRPRGRPTRMPVREAAPEDLFDALRAAGRVTVVVDAPDEADDPDGLVRELLLPLAGTAADPVPECRVLLGTGLWPDSMPELRAAVAGRPDRLLDLDTEEPAVLAEDLSTYLTRLLDPEYPSGTAEAIARRLSGAAEQGAFLTAALYGTHLRALSEAGAAPSAEEIIHNLPCSLTNMFRLNLSMLVAERPWTGPVLKAVARAAGQGMPAHVVHAVALALTPEVGRRRLPPRLRDTEEALVRARFYLRTAHDQAGPGPGGATLYRFFHQVLTAHMAARSDATVVKRAVLSTVPLRDGVPDWSRADPYLLRHAADHAADAGQQHLDALLEDASHLLYAVPDRISQHLHRAVTPQARLHAAVYRQTTAHHPRRHGVAARRDLLDLDATVWRDTALSEALAAPPGLPPPLARPAWAVSRTATTARLQTLDPRSGPVTRVAFAHAPGAEWHSAGDLVVVTAGRCGVSLWDPLRGSTLSRFGGPEGQGRQTVAEVARMAGGDPVLVSAGEDDLLVHDLRTGALLRRLTGGKGPVRMLTTVTVQDGLRALTVGPRSEVLLWNLEGEDGRPVVLNGSMPAVNDLAATLPADGTTAVGIAVGEDRVAVVWDLRKGQRLRRLGRHKDFVGAVATARLRDGTAVAVTGGHDGRVVVWNPFDGARLHTLTGHTDQVTCLAAAAVGGRWLVASGGRDGRVLVWDVDEGRQVHNLGEKQGVITCVALGGGGAAESGPPRDGWLVAGCTEGRVAVWDVASGTRTHLLAAHSDGVHSVDVGRAGDCALAVSGGADGTAVVWDITSARPEGPPEVFDDETQAVAVGRSQAGAALFVGGGGDRGAEVRDLTTGGRLHVLADAGRKLLVRALATDELPDVGPVAVAGSRNGALRMWDLTDGSLLRTFPGPVGRIRAVATGRAADGRPIVVAGGDESTATAWESVTGRRLVTFTGHRGRVLGVAVGEVPGSPGVAVSGDHLGALLLWDPLTGTEVAALSRAGGRINALTAARSEGRPVVVSGGDEGDVLLWDLENPGVAEHLTGLRHRVTALATARLPDGRVLAVGGGEDRCVAVWDLATRTESGARCHLPAAITGIAACGTGLVVAHEAGTAYLTWCGDILAPALRSDPSGRAGHRAPR
ncbi:hypothetical protein ACIPSA_38310 [Streptomyces sp. NPDC086549]|uniref:hypothetical protein n=1 Tax=Streptomyces sp. NPDC086549 TaxID=3365752 RepID=UPI003810DD4E